MTFTLVLLFLQLAYVGFYILASYTNHEKKFESQTGLGIRFAVATVSCGLLLAATQNEACRVIFGSIFIVNSMFPLIPSLCFQRKFKTTFGNCIIFGFAVIVFLVAMKFC